MLLRLTGTVSRIVEYLCESNSRIDTTCGGFDKEFLAGIERLS